MIDQNLILYLQNLGTAAAARFHTGNAPQLPTFPLAVVRRTSGSTPRTLGGTKLFSRATFSIDALARDYADALSVANAVRDALDTFTGSLPSDPVGSETTVQSCRCTAEPADYSEIDGDLVLRRISQEFLFVYLET